MAYVTTSDYLEYAHVDTYDSDDEARWTNFIARATARIEDITGRSFEATATTGTSDAPVTRYFDALYDVDGAVLYFDAPICEITTVTNGDSVVVSDTEYVTEPRNETPYYAIRIRSSANKYWTYTDDNENAIQVAGIWAQSKTPPDSIKDATLRLVKWIEDRRTANIDLDRPALTGDGITILPMRLPSDIMDALRPYMTVKIG